MTVAIPSTLGCLPLTTMNHVERFRAVMEFQPVDRLPRWEWAMWWDMTIAAWKKQGLPGDLDSVFEIAEFFDLDPYQQFWFSTTEATIDAKQHHTEGTVADMDDYLRILPGLYPDHGAAIREMQPWARRQAGGDAVVWCTLEGFFWFPRTLMDIEKLSFAYYDQPELVHRINHDLCEFNLRLIDQFCAVCPPTFLTLAEDMSFNHGPMISRDIFDEFMAPYYRRLLDRLAEEDIYVIVDTDGDVTKLVPWLLDVGVHGVLPLERQAGVDGSAIREEFPDIRIVGHFNKLVMDQGEQAMRDEFERLLPLMRAGGFIPSVDHQTPPNVTIGQYRLYRRLLDEYTAAAGG